MTKTNRPLLITVIILLFLPIVLLQKTIDPQRHQFEPNLTNSKKAMGQLPIEFALGAATGFSQAIAGLLWVRTDEFFDKGDYDAIIPMVRIITWLDPHNIDVYETGAWHMDYNFTDSDQRSDRRYIPIAIALLQEGVANNPEDSEILADLAFTHYFRKISDFPRAVACYLQAEKIPNWDVTKVGHGLAHAYISDGQIQKAIDQWKYCIQEHQVRIAQDKDSLMIASEQSGLIIAKKNLEETEARYKWRQTQTKPPADVAFSVKVTRIAPMVLVVTGTLTTLGSPQTPAFDLKTGTHGPWAIFDGSRVDVRLQDASYVIPSSATFSLNNNISSKVTIMQESISVRNGKFQRKLDMSQDHLGADAMYSFTAPSYTFEVWFNPSNPNSSPPNVGDRLGWIGEGLTDKHYLDASGNVPATAGAHIPGLRIVNKTIILSRDDIMGTDVKEFD